MRSLVLALCLATPVQAPVQAPVLAPVQAQAQAQTVFDRAAGVYGSAIDPLQSCDTNPHRLSVITNPPHVVLRWTRPRRDFDGSMSIEDIYDLRGATGSTLSLHREGEARLPETGQRPTWILRLTSKGYCMGRTDWPLVRCVNAAIRCGNGAPVS